MELTPRRFVNSGSKTVSDKPSEFVLKKAFAAFGEIRIVDIPMLDAYRSESAGASSSPSPRV